MRKISTRVKDELLKRPQVCILTGDRNIVWHHCLIYARKQIDEVYAIQFLREDLHGNNRSEMWAEYVAIKTGISHLTIHYNKFDWFQRLWFLEAELGLK